MRLSNNRLLTRTAQIWLLVWVFGLGAAERQVDPTFLHRVLASASEKKSDLTTATCHYKPLFGEGDSQTSVVVGVARFGEAIVDAGGSCATVSYPEEDQVYVLLEGNGSAKYADENVALKKEDYLYLPATIPHNLANKSNAPLRVVVMGFHLKGLEKAPLPPHPLKANIEDVRTQPVSGHPTSALYRLLMGDIDSKRDRIAAGRAITSMFLMEIAPSGTNFPHHHEREEEIYFVESGGGKLHSGDGAYSLKQGDFTYLPPGLRHSISSDSDEALRVLVMGFKVPAKV